MKKFMALMMVLLLMFSMMLTGCGGGAEEPAEEPAATEEPAEEPAAEEISKNDLSLKYNEAAALYNEVYTLLNEKGIYGTDTTTTETMNALNNTMIELAPAIEADDLAPEDKQIVSDSLDTIATELANMKSIAEGM